MDEPKEGLDIALLSVCREGCFEVAARLLDMGASPNAVQENFHIDWSPIRYACKFGNVDFFRKLLKRGAIIDSNDYIALCLASSKSFEIVETLLAHKVSPNPEKIQCTIQHHC